MKVYCFQPRFAPLVESGVKPHTMRPRRKRPPVVGELLSLRQWMGTPYRAKQRLLREANCTALVPSCIDENRVLFLNNERVPTSAAEEFAVNDGFPSYRAMIDWFAAAYGLPFFGEVVYWDPFAPLIDEREAMGLAKRGVGSGSVFSFQTGGAL